MISDLDDIIVIKFHLWLFPVCFLTSTEEK